jgi:hypothetical protein
VWLPYVGLCKQGFMSLPLQAMTLDKFRRWGRECKHSTGLSPRLFVDALRFVLSSRSMAPVLIGQSLIFPLKLQTQRN